MAASASTYSQTLASVYEDVLRHVQLNQQGATPTIATVQRQVPAVRSRLMELANEPDGFITYGALVQASGTNPNYLGVVLGAIGHCEHRLGNPNLSALVVNSETEGPAGGFFNWSYIPPTLHTERAEGRRLTRPERAFWKRQVAKVRRHDWGR
jgi:hypothetical protein